MNTPISFEIAKLLKEKGFDEQSINFYTKPNSKMFGIDEHYRNYPIKNTPKKLYKLGFNAVLNIENIYFAPTIAEVVMWLYEKHGIWISVEATDDFTMFCFRIRKKEISRLSFNYNSLTEAYEAAIEYTLKNLI